MALAFSGSCAVLPRSLSGNRATSAFRSRAAGTPAPRLRTHALPLQPLGFAVSVKSAPGSCKPEARPSLHPIGRGSVAARAADPSTTNSSELGETAKANLRRAAANCKRLGWISFWTQLVLSTVSIVILLFSVAFSQSTGPTISLYLTIFGVLAGFFTTAWAFRYTRIARSIRTYLDSKEGLLPPEESKNIKKVSKLEVVRSLNWGAFVNLLGMGATIIGLQATVGVLVAKTLTNATANPFLAGGAGSYNPVLALDVFLVQASTNTILSHFCGIVFSLWLARSIDGNAGFVAQTKTPPSGSAASSAA